MIKYEKGRNWASVCYPESCPTNWLDILQDTRLQIAISPLHDKDLNPDGTVKKPHYHILFMFDGPTTKNRVKAICDSINAVNPIKIDSARGMYRYHIHIDNPDKYQYDDRDRILLNGFDKSNLDSFTEMEIDKLENDILDLIESFNIIEYRDLIKLLKDNLYLNLLYVAKKRTIMLNAYLKSRKYSLKNI